MSTKSLGAVKKRIAERENGRVEFKQTTGQLERGMETLCAFLNGEGGTVLFGVTDKGKIVGQEVSDKTKRDIADAVHRLEPMAVVEISYVSLPKSEKKVVVFHVEEARLERPYCYKGRAYMRVESTTTTMPQSKYNELLLHRDGGKYRWEQFANEDLTLQDLDHNEILKTVRLGIECGRLPEDTGNKIPVILKKLGVSKDGVLNHAAAVLFGKHETMQYPQCLLRLARFKGTNKMVFMDNRRVHGNLFQLLNEAMAFLFKHLSISGTTDTLERDEHLSIPYKALREGVLNSLVHRSYREAGGSVGIAIYDDRVEIENPGDFPHDWDMEKMKTEHCSDPQNPLIANVVYKRKLLEMWGRGISLIADECKSEGLPEPEYRVGGGFVVLVFRLKPKGQVEESESPHHRITTQPHDHITTQVKNKTTSILRNRRQLTTQPPNHLTTQVENLIVLIGDNTYSVAEMMDKLQLNNRSYFTKEYLQTAITAGVIKPLYPDNLNHPKQKYRLTEKGKELLK